jgi:hypothetical protein
MDAKAWLIEELSDFKAWVLQNPNAHKLLKQIIFKWRADNMPSKKLPGKWSVHTRPEWMSISQLSRGGLDRALKTLKADGLVLSVRHLFKGTGVHVFLQPTARLHGTPQLGYLGPLGIPKK